MDSFERSRIIKAHRRSVVDDRYPPDYSDREWKELYDWEMEQAYERERQGQWKTIRKAKLKRQRELKYARELELERLSVKQQKRVDILKDQLTKICDQAIDKFSHLVSSQNWSYCAPIIATPQVDSFVEKIIFEEDIKILSPPIDENYALIIPTKHVDSIVQKEIISVELISHIVEDMEKKDVFDVVHMAHTLMLEKVDSHDIETAPVEFVEIFEGPIVEIFEDPFEEEIEFKGIQELFDESLEDKESLTKIDTFKLFEIVDVIKSSGLIAQSIKEFQSSHIYVDPFSINYNPLKLVVADFLAVEITIFARMMAQLFIHLLVLNIVDYISILRSVWLTFIFDPGGFEDESFRRVRI